MIPNLPDVTQIPEASWQGWEPIFTELQVDRSNDQLVKETVHKCQAMLGNLLQAALHSGSQHGGVQQPGVELGPADVVPEQVLVAELEAFVHVYVLLCTGKLHIPGVHEASEFQCSHHVRTCTFWW